MGDLKVGDPEGVVAISAADDYTTGAVVIFVYVHIDCVGTHRHGISNSPAA
jgi:hypothetical protein